MIVGRDRITVYYNSQETVKLEKLLATQTDACASYILDSFICVVINAIEGYFIFFNMASFFMLQNNISLGLFLYCKNLLQVQLGLFVL